MKYRNPIIPGFYPDPSICRAGADYYLVNSTFEYFPGVPVHHSRDLVNWRTIGHCLTRDSQLPLKNMRCSGGIFAPTLRFHEGRFYMVTTNVDGRGNFFVWTDDPAGEWSEPIWLRMTGIDPSLFFDEDGVVYLTGQSREGIQQASIDIETGEQLSESRIIWRGTGGAWPEGPHLYKMDGTYDLMIAEGGTHTGHMETIARSGSPWGPFEPCPHNPILTHRDLSSHAIHGTGHADLFEDGEGNWWLVFLAFRQHGGNYHVLGRETFLAPVTWNEEGWPVVNDGEPIREEMEGPLPGPETKAGPLERDDFDDPALAPEWVHLRNPVRGNYQLTARPGFLRLKGTELTLSALDSPTFVGRRQQHFEFSASACIEFSPSRDGEEAGLTVLANNDHHYEIAVTRRNGERKVIVRRRIGDLEAVVAESDAGEGGCRLVIEGEGTEYVLRAGPVGGGCSELARGRMRYLSTEVAGGFTGVMVGLYATGNGRAADAPADFDWFEYKAKR